MATNNKYPLVAWQDPDDVPDLSTPEWQAIFDRVPVRRGRPPVLSPKVSTNIRLDADILEAYRAQGPGWQTRINEVLRQHLEREGRGG
jgi:uncharacterized protein (DUF4415 family)